jgi:lipopolysaccharide transport system permease protein
MQNFSMTPAEMVTSLWRNRYLIKTSIKREVVGRYRGSSMGILWSFFHPVFMLAVYTFVFSVIFKARWQSGSDSKTEFALILFSGLIVFNLFSECINRAPGLILGHPNYVKKVIFPLEILSIVSLGTALFHAMVSFVVWLIAYFMIFGMPHWTIVFMPVVLLPLLLLTAGFSWWLSALGVYLRDVSQVVGIMTTALLFLSPIFYSAARLPERFRFAMQFNPLTPVVEQIRNALFWGEVPNMKLLSIYLFCSLLVAWLGFAWFQKTRKGFADVL